MKKLFTLCYILIGLQAYSQITISQFDFSGTRTTDLNTKRVLGPAATSFSASVATNSEGVLHLRGCNPNAGMDLRLPGSSFNVPSVEMTFRFRRYENGATFFRRGNSFRFYIQGNQLRIDYQVLTENGAVRVNQNTRFLLASDRFSDATFRYEAWSGVAKVIVDDQVIWSDTTAPGALVWTNDDVFVGQQMDGVCEGAYLQSFSISQIFEPAPEDVLPITLTHFSGQAQATGVELRWETATEINNDFFTVERSADGRQFEAIGHVVGAGNTHQVMRYTYTDELVRGTHYYRLRQTDFDGTTTVSHTLRLESHQPATVFTCYPNPGNGHQLSVRASASLREAITVEIVNAQGAVVLSQRVAEGHFPGDVTIYPGRQLRPGLYRVTFRTSAYTQSSSWVVR